jgi:hypothetical protein
MATRTKDHSGSLKQGRMGRKRTRTPPKSLTPWERRVAAHLGKLIGDRSGDVADAVGVSHDAVLKWCAGESFPSLDKWPKIASALGLSDPRDLLPAS